MGASRSSSGFWRRVTAAGVLVLVVGASLGCGDPFRPETLVDRLRVLGVRSEPPAVGLADVAALEALVIDPLGDGRQVTYTWAVCLLEISDVAEEILCPGPDTYPLPGSGPTTELSMPDLVAWALEQDFPLDPGQIPGEPDELDSFPLIIGLRVEAGDESLQTLKRVEVRLVDGLAPSTNPRLSGLELEDQPVGAGPISLRAQDKKVRFRPLADAASRDEYTPTGADEAQLEDFLFSWFSTTGEFEDRWTVMDVATDGTDLAVNKFILPKVEEEYGEHGMWIVVRDGRNGMDWVQYDLEITP